MALLSKGTSGFFCVAIAMAMTTIANIKTMNNTLIPHLVRCQRVGLFV
jgi:hypothetical protein